MDNSDNPLEGKKPEEIIESSNAETPVAESTEEKSQVASGNNVAKKPRFKFPKIPLNRNTVLASSLALLLVVVGVFTLVLTSGNSEEENQTQEVVEEQEEVQLLGAAILIDEGTLQIVSKETGEWQDANTTTQIEQGSELRTVGATSRAVIGFDDGSALRLDANSGAVIEKLTTERIEIKHVSGYTYNRVLPSDTLTYVVTSKDAQYEALGTAFRTSTTGDEQSVEVYHSSVIETNTNKSPKEGEKLIVENKSQPSENGTIKKIDIEEVKNDPFMEWNRELDINDENFKDSLGFLGDVTAPEISVDKNDGDVVLLEPNASEGTIELTGKTESGAKLTVQSKSQPGSTTVDVNVASDGSFKTPVLSAPIGNSVFEFIATDRAGNKATKTLRITFQRKSQPVAGNEVSFVLSNNSTSEEVKISWSFNGVEAPDGIKMVYGKSSKPLLTDTEAKSEWINDSSARNWSKKISKLELGDGTYYFFACIYNKDLGECGQYSGNEISINIP